MIELGIVIKLGDDIEKNFIWAKNIGFSTCQIISLDGSGLDDHNARKVYSISKKHDVRVTTIISLWPPPAVWDFQSGPSTLGLVPEKYREQRLKIMLQACDFAGKLPGCDLSTHMGFIPEDPKHKDYSGTVDAIAEIAQKCRDKGLRFNLETGQETPITLKRAITDAGMNNIGVNFDPANLIMYGKANPMDAMDILARYINGVHAKDGLYPTDPRYLGAEAAIGSGLVDFKGMIGKLKAIGYDGAIIIERETDGAQQIKDIKESKKYLDKILCDIYPEYTAADTEVL